MLPLELFDPAPKTFLTVVQTALTEVRIQARIFQWKNFAQGWNYMDDFYRIISIPNNITIPIC